MAHNSISLLSLVLAFGSLVVTAQNLTPENGGAAPAAASPTAADGAVQGASGAGNGINISKGALVAIIVVIALVAIIGIGSAVLYYLAKKRQWELRKSLRRRTRRLTSSLGSRRPGSARPGSRPRPSGTRPSGTRPSGAQPSGTRPSGARPDGTRGVRPQGQPADRLPSKLRDGEKAPSAPETRQVKKETPTAKVVDLEKGTPEKSSFEVDPVNPKSWRQKLSLFGGKK